jgi:hypothetical protein
MDTDTEKYQDQDRQTLNANPDPDLAKLCRSDRIQIHNTVGNFIAVLRIRIRDPGSGAFLTPGSGIRNRFFPNPGSLTHIFESLVTIF